MLDNSFKIIYANQYYLLIRSNSVYYRVDKVIDSFQELTKESLRFMLLNIHIEEGQKVPPFVRGKHKTEKAKEIYKIIESL